MLGSEERTAPLKLGLTGILTTTAIGSEMSPTIPATSAITTIGWSAEVILQACAWPFSASTGGWWAVLWSYQSLS